jgi:hypothetical protein
MKRSIALILLAGLVSFYSATFAQSGWKPEQIQAGFYTPKRIGQLWDTWIYYYEGRYYQYYLAGIGGKWDSFELMTSTDGVNWREHGRILEPRPGTTWMGTGHIIEAPGFKTRPKWIMNYSEWFGDKQDIMFATSTDLLNWQKVDESLRFRQDERWYKPKGRWDCIDAVQRVDGSYYGYFTADPLLEKFDRPVCGFGFAESTDGISWTAMPPVEGNMTGEFGGIQNIGNKYFITISEGRVGVSDHAEGPFLAQEKNPNMFGEGCDIYFPRFFHNPPADKTMNRNGALVNHFYTGSATIFSAPVKAVEIDGEGILRLKWWDQNDLLKKQRNKLSHEKSGNNPGPVKLFAEHFNLDDVGIVESFIRISDDDHRQNPAGVYFAASPDSGFVLLVNREQTVFGTMKADGSNLRITVKIDRDIRFSEKSELRLVFKKDMMEAYVDDYLMMLKRMNWTGKLGTIGPARNFTRVRSWVHD